MVSDNRYSSKQHKFANFRLNFNYFALKAKVQRQIILFFIELEIDSFCELSKQNKTFLLWNESKNKNEITSF